MSREQEYNAGGRGGQTVGPPDSGSVDETTGDLNGVQAQAAGYGNVDWIRTGSYYDLNDRGDGFSATTDTFIATDVPPGSSYNSDHYATDDGPGASRSEASSELIAAVIRLEGQMQQGPECDFTWYKPDTSIAYEGSATIDDPTDCGYDTCYYLSAFFYTFIGRDFSHDGMQEVGQRGTYTVEFATSYGTYDETVEVIGPQLTSCDTPTTIQAETSAEFGATIGKPISDNNSYNGDIVVAEDMRYTNNRNVIHREPFSISGFQDTKGVSFDVPASAFDQFGGVGSDTETMMWAETYGF